MRQDTPEEFMRYLTCKIELMPHFLHVSSDPSPSQITNNVLFKQEFTYDNWLSSKIGKRYYKTGFSKITSKGATIFGKHHEVKDNFYITEGYEYSIYRFINYNFKRVVHINN